MWQNKVGIYLKVWNYTKCRIKRVARYVQGRWQGNKKVARWPDRLGTRYPKRPRANALIMH